MSVKRGYPMLQPVMRPPLTTAEIANSVDDRLSLQGSRNLDERERAIVEALLWVMGARP
jgi:hypothetical protein